MIIRDLALVPGMPELGAELLLEGFKGTGTPSLSAIEGCRETLAPLKDSDAIAYATVDENGRLLGLIGGLACYDGHAFELHPLVVHPSVRKRGVASALVRALEVEAARRGASMLWVGSDDEDNRTSIGGIDLYPDALAKLRDIKNIRDHPFEVYQKLGFEIVGVLPDANGFGKPDIFMAKRLAKPA